MEVVDAASDYFASIRRYQVTRFRRVFPTVQQAEADKRYRRQRAPSQRRADRQERGQAGQRQEERGVGTVLRIEGAIFPDKHYESGGRSESADIPTEYKLVRRRINPEATGADEFQRRSSNAISSDRVPQGLIAFFLAYETL